MNSAPSQSLKEQPQVIDENSDLPELPSDPGKRFKITKYHPLVERVQRKYYQDGPCQPNLKNFPQRDSGGIMRRFNRSWYDEFSWLEYSIDKDAAFCLCCYIFKNELGQGGGDAFTLTGFRDWKHKHKLRKHEGSINSAHRQAFSKCEDLLNEKQHIEPILLKTTNEEKMSYRARLNASIDCVRWLLKQGLAFRGHDESEQSSNQGTFLELLKFLASHSEDVRRVVLENAPIKLKLIAPRIQKDIVRACASETTQSILEELGVGVFCVLLDDSRDVSIKEQMAVALRFVDKNGQVLERILGFKHVECTSAISLKVALEDLLNAHGLTISMLRGQGYDERAI
ncbi:hypothetical protein OROHE_023474 [Orobanche hederae]